MKNLFFAGLLIFFYYDTIAQTNSSSVINSSGGTFEKGNITYEWSVGELALVNHMESKAGKFILTNGFLQTFNNVYFKTTNGLRFTDNEIHILPNPTKDNITIHFGMSHAGRLKLILFNDLGIIVFKSDVIMSGYENYHTVRMKHLSQGNYTLSIELIPADLLVYSKKRAYQIIKIQ